MHHCVNCIFWKENIYLGMVVGTALACNTVIAVCLGSVLQNLFLSHQTTNDIRKDLEKNAETYKNYDVQYTYIVNKNKKLLGVIPLRELFFSSKNTLLIEILHKKIITIPIISNIEQIRNYFNDHSYLAFPVVDENHKLLGVLKRDSVEHFLKKRNRTRIFEINRDYGGEKNPILCLYH